MGSEMCIRDSFGGVQEKEALYPGKYHTEWEFLSRVLIENGVPKEAVLKEEKATYTYENAIYSRKVTDKARLEIRQAILCCKPYHARRSLLYYQLLYPDTRFLVCPVKESSIRKDNWYQTEQGTKVVLGEMERIGIQFHEIIGEIRKEEPIDK